MTKTPQIRALGRGSELKNGGISARGMQLRPCMMDPEEVAVFTDTSLGTHLAIAVPPDITVGDLKKELEKTHLGCFREFGQIRVHSLTVKRKLNFYHLPETVPLKCVFHGWNKSWYLCAEASLLNGSHRPRCNDNRTADFPIIFNSKSDGRFGHGNRIGFSGSVRFPRKSEDILINFSEKICLVSRGETVAVDEDVTQEKLQKQLKGDCNLSGTEPSGCADFAVQTPPRTRPSLSGIGPPPCGPNRNKPRRVGRRLLEALNRIQMHRRKENPLLSLCRRKNQRLVGRSYGSLPKFEVFEIPDSDD